MKRMSVNPSEGNEGRVDTSEAVPEGAADRLRGPAIPVPQPSVIAYRSRNDGCRTLERVSEGVRRITGFAPADFTSGRVHWAELVHPDDLPQVRDGLLSAVRAGRPFQLEYRIRCRDGSVRWVWEQGQGIEYAGDEAVALEGFVTDVTERKRAEEALIERHERDELLAAGTCDAIWDWDIPNHRVVFSPRWKELRGLAPDEVGDHEEEWSSRIHPEDAPRVMAAVQAHFAGETAVFAQEYRVRCKDGAWKWIRDRGIARRDAAGRAVRMAGWESDITERRQAVAALTQAHRRADQRAAELEAVLHTVPAAVWIAHDAACRHITGNRTADAWLRLPSGAEASLTARDEERPSHFKIRQNGRELRGDELPVQRAARGIEVRNFEEEIVLADGSVRPVFGNATPLWDAQGHPCGSVAAFVDITERKRTEESLRRQVELNRYYLDTVQTVIVALDAEGRISMINRKGRETLGYAEPELLGRNWFDICLPQPDGMDAIYPVFRRIMAGELAAVEYFENPIRCRDGRLRLIAWHNANLRDTAGTIIGTLSSGEDITERKQAEEALREADRHKDEFLATLAHELRNPLAPIRHAAEILRLKGPPDPALQAAQDIIARQIGHLVRLIDDLMEVNRISRGRLRLRREQVELSAVLTQVLDSFRPQAERAGHALIVSLPPDPIDLDADPVRLAQVFQNLLDNACKYTGKGGRIRLSAERDGAQVVVKVADTGIGIAPDHLPRVFEMFSQLDANPEQSQGGLGIGLALARGLVEMHGGRIAAKSEGPGKGTEFSVRLPTLAASPAGQTRVAPGRAEVRATAGARILVVDDNADVVHSLAMLLELTGYRVETARDGLEAVAAAERFRPHLILLDIGMPRLDGYGACRRIREQPWGKDLRIVALTGWGQDDARRKSRETGFDGHLVKPVDPAALRRLLAELAPAKPP